MLIPTPKRMVKPSLWALNLIIVFEILFMISPLALYFYSLYGPLLRAFNGSEGTAWLTQFFLPHISDTTSPLLNLLHILAGPLLLLGTVLFLGRPFLSTGARNNLLLDPHGPCCRSHGPDPLRVLCGEETSSYRFDELKLSINIPPRSTKLARLFLHPRLQCVLWNG